MRKRPLLSRLCAPLLAAALLLAPSAGALAAEFPSAAYIQTLQTRNAGTDAQYFGGQLSGEAKLIYSAFCLPENLTKSRSEQTITLTGFPQVTPSQSAINAAMNKLANAAANAAAAFDRDYPGVFWMGNMHTSVTPQATQSGQVSLTLDIRFDLATGWGAGKRSVADDEAALTAAVTSMAAAAPTDSRASTVAYFHDWLVKNNEYNRTAAARGSSAYRDSAPWKAVSAMNTALSPVCEGYARALKLLCNQVGIPCVIVSGYSDGEPHMWNYVQLEDGTWYAVDATFDDPIGGGTGLASGSESSEYLLVGSTSKNDAGQTFSRSHQNRGDDFISYQSVDFTYPTLSQTAYGGQTVTPQPTPTPSASPAPSAQPSDPAPAEPSQQPAIPAGPSTGWTNPFADIIAGEWYYEAVRQGVETGLFTGTSNGTFSPNAPMTRAMLVTTLWRSAGTPQGDAAAFSDVTSDTWYAQAVAWAASVGVVDGVGEGLFAPDLDITREQLAAILYRYQLQLAPDTALNGEMTGFTDLAAISDWAGDGMLWAVSSGLLTGRGEGILAPGATASRAEVAVIFLRMTPDAA